ncbi:MAG: peptide deformylase [Candidatus Improbicoccus pseudotrichonymphae]|uniref:Peptide deformylase n=1 Tax=Candidatus Improbicoccus pseudotrichonymphae TaxID=3033792 RepID=A0AA48I8T5_9FIRM|nr:MAG: peptide deformylase [Candidatus Improbicoccus pseudotrichonymphae]
MTLRKIVFEGDPVLGMVSKSVESFDSELFELLDDMKETLISAKGVGLAAPQIGLLKRVAIVLINDDLTEMINPEILEKKGNRVSNEGCLSCPGFFGATVRPKSIKVRAQDRNGNSFVFSCKDFKAQAVCHEIDHLDGILFKKRLA